MKVQTKKLFVDGALIVFSVLFALFISQVVENKKAEREKEQALAYIYQELEDNQKILGRWIYTHGEIRDRLRRMVANPGDSIRQQLETSPRMDFEIITNGQVLIDALLTETAWEAAKATGVASGFDFENVQQLTRVYGLQRILMDNTTGKFLDVYMDRQTHEKEHLETTLIQLSLVMDEMVGQEHTLSYMIGEVLKEQDKDQ